MINRELIPATEGHELLCLQSELMVSRAAVARLELRNQQLLSALATSQQQLAASEEAALRTQNMETAFARLRDHSQRIEAEIVERNRELSCEKALVDHIVASIPVGILYLDRDMVIRWANAELVRVMGLGSEQIVNRSVFDVLPKLDPWDVLCEAVLAKGETARFTGYPIVVGDRRHYVDATLVPLFEDDRAVQGMLLFATEVSARVENERLQQEQIETLRELDRLKGNFINAASHELRTPLTSIMGYAEFLEDQVGGALTRDQQGFVSQIQEGAKRLQRIVDDMLDFARMEAGSFKLVLREADLGLLIHEELTFLQPLLQEARLTLHAELPDERLAVPMDPSRIGQVLRNLLGNAIKFTPAGGQVSITMHAGPDEVHVAISDTGIGISDQHVEMLFQKFFQVDASITREHGGAGLGLSIAKALIEAHGGKLGVESRIESGSTFWFTLPRLAETDELIGTLD